MALHAPCDEDTPRKILFGDKGAEVLLQTELIERYQHA